MLSLTTEGWRLVPSPDPGWCFGPSSSLWKEIKNGVHSRHANRSWQSLQPLLRPLLPRASSAFSWKATGWVGLSPTVPPPPSRAGHSRSPAGEGLPCPRNSQSFWRGAPLRKQKMSELEVISKLKLIKKVIFKLCIYDHFHKAIKKSYHF